MRGRKYTIKFAEDLKDGHTFTLSPGYLNDLTVEDIYMRILKELGKAGVRLKVEELEQ